MTSTEEAIRELFGNEEDETSFVSEESDDNEENVNSDEMRDARTEEAFEVMVRDGPQMGMLFESKEQLYEAYNSYAKVKGFNIFSRNTSSNGNYCRMTCDRGGKVCSKKYTKKTNCLAHINAIRQPTGFWMVSSVCIEHNHDLDMSMSAFMPGHRHLTLGLKRQLEANDRACIRICKNVKLMEVLAGGPENIGATTKDCRNFIDKRRRLRLGEGDAEAISQLFSRLQKSDARFFHLMDIDDHGRLRNVMWIHPRSIAAYEEFHDVVSFDTTYLVNQYHMPIATVVGVNHHNQSILLGCGLLTHEYGESFKWFFKNWLGAMGGVQPTAILTDQCDSIRIAVREVIPETVHRYCSCHILQKVPVKLKGSHDHKTYSNSFYRLIYDSLSISDFERRWTDFIAEYSFQDNRWLRDLYSERENWVPIYLNHLFWAGMVSTQRSESMHAFFDGYVNSRSTLS
ncbi:protein FAR-RED IMPAIRED RESPONSE 1-like [Salvia miltiorrhiza]|uniref:protein FAR-RED IMPAIRED RESPONSE 1-like n=1 Tax=Salvia miltiorrhiza TaxID=226208 RepID=UPI0025AD240B|nr:protein FAR-RED IMPAIRED RESPONSE 1-like [Salvia miltiorrhiza]